MNMVIYRHKGSKALSEEKPAKNISKSLQSFLEISSMQKEVLLSQNCKTMHMSNRILSD